MCLKNKYTERPEELITQPRVTGINHICHRKRLPEVPVCAGEREKCFLLRNVEINLSVMLGRELSRMWSWIFGTA